MEKRSDNYCVILAGGKGKRLWPTSRKDCPKQFIDFFGTGRTLLQSTFDRLARIIPVENIFVCTRQKFVGITRQQLPTLPEGNIMAEPVNRNTAPPVAWAGVRIHRLCENARIIVVPSDQFIVNDDAYLKCVASGLDFVENNDLILTMGIQPTRPEPGYGYIQMGEPTLQPGITKVQSFTEKPERDFARIFMESGEFLWNTGMFLTNVNYLRHFFFDVIKDISSRLAPVKDMNTIDEEMEYVFAHFPAYPNLSMDKAALELHDNAYVMKCDFGWADIGTWHSIFEFKRYNGKDNVIIDSDVIVENCRSNIIKLPKGHVGVISGLEGFIVAEQGDVLLICPRGDSSALIKKYINEVAVRYGDKYL